MSTGSSRATTATDTSPVTAARNQLPGQSRTQPVVQVASRRVLGEELCRSRANTASDTVIAIAKEIRTSIRELGMLQEGSENGIVDACQGATVFTGDSSGELSRAYGKG